jgi:ribosomal protein S24E
MAYIYSSLEAMAVEPSYIHKRHEPFRTSSPQKEESSEGGDE